jgi:hypothetical protein
MKILRLPPYPLSISYAVPAASTAYDLIIEDEDRDAVILEKTITSTSGKKLNYTFETDDWHLYDKVYALRIQEQDEDIVVEDMLEIKRPYVDPTTLETTATEIAETTQRELTARLIIDAITGGFYYTTETIEHIGLNTDYAPVKPRTRKVLKVYQNNELWYDSSLEEPAIFGVTYKLSDNKTGIIQEITGAYNRADQAPLMMPTAQSDWLGPIGWGNTFSKSSDYTFIVETGYKVVPTDIKEATLMLMDDIKCGRLDYFKRYASAYNTDQFRIQFEKSLFNGTGNLIVDKILERYASRIIVPGVL